MITLKSLKKRHQEHKEKSDHWDTLTALIKGGDEVTNAIKKKLLPNPDNRKQEVIEERVKLATYTAKITPIISRFVAELFGSATLPTGSKDGQNFWEKEFFPNGALLSHDDDGRTSFISFCQQAMLDALTTGKAIALVDTRKTSGRSNKEQQKAEGELNPYVMLFPRSALWDWKADSNGFVFTKIHQFRLFQKSWNSEPIPQHIFTIYQREDDGRILASKYIVSKIKKDNFISNEDPQPFIDRVTKDDEVIIQADVLENGQLIENIEVFNLGGKFEFPIVTLTLPKHLHMTGQLYELQKSYFQQSAAIEYALYTSNYGLLYVTGVDTPEDDPLQGKAIGEKYYIALKENQSLGWLEKNNSSVSTAITYKGETKRDIYDMLQQIAMSASDGASIVARSGESKREDRRPESLLLETFGVILKDFILQIMKPASIARGENTIWEITGYSDFIRSGFMDAVTDYLGIRESSIFSATFNRESQKHFIKSVAKGIELSPSLLAKALKEVDKTPDKKFLPAEDPAITEDYEAEISPELDISAELESFMKKDKEVENNDSTKKVDKKDDLTDELSSLMG